MADVNMERDASDNHGSTAALPTLSGTAYTDTT
jgi:hypothetical protein